MKKISVTVIDMTIEGKPKKVAQDECSFSEFVETDVMGGKHYWERSECHVVYDSIFSKVYAQIAEGSLSILIREGDNEEQRFQYAGTPNLEREQVFQFITPEKFEFCVYYIPEQ